MSGADKLRTRSRLRRPDGVGRAVRRQSSPVRALTETVGGLYITAIREEGRLPALHRFTEAIASHAGLQPATLRLTDWHQVPNDWNTSAACSPNRATARTPPSSCTPRTASTRI